MPFRDRSRIRFGSWFVALVGVVIWGAVLLPGGGSAAPEVESVPGEVVVGLRDGAGAGARGELERRAGVRLGRRLTPRGAWLAGVRAGETTAQAIARLNGDPAVRWAEPNYLYRSFVVPNDPLLSRQWGLINTGQVVGGVSGGAGADIGAPAAWGITTGSDRVRVAVVDGGVDHTHPDLAPSIGVVNPDEAGDGRETNGLDDDGNGLIDDWRGWDFIADDGDPQDDILESHGTVVAGVIGARGNDGFGSAGVVWSSRTIPVRGLDSQGRGNSADLAAAIAYASSRGARILNASFGSEFSSTAIREAIEAAPNTLIVAAAGNGDRTGNGVNVDGSSPTFPCAYTLENIVCVAASDQSDALATFSNFGATSVDLAAPGVNISGPRRGGGSTILDGTSFAAPHVSGVAALVLAANPTASTRRLRRALLDGVEPLAALSGMVATGGRLDAFGALTRVPAAEPGPGGSSGPVVEVTTSSARLTGNVPASGQRLSYYFEHGVTTAYGSATPTRAIGPSAAREVSESIGRLAVGSEHHARLVVAGVGGITLGTDQAFATSVPPAPPPPDPVVTTRPSPPAAPTATVRRIRGSWFISLRLDEFSVVSGRLQRREVRTAKASLDRAPQIRFRTVRGIRRRGFEAGVRRVPLGRLGAGRYRLSLSIRGADGPTTLVRTLRVRSSMRRAEQGARESSRPRASVARNQRGPASAFARELRRAPVAERPEVVSLDASSGRFVDSDSDSGLEVGGPAELIVNTINFRDIDPGIVTDDLVEFVSTFDTSVGLPGSQADLDGNDAVSFDLDLDGNQSTGSTSTGSELSLIVFGNVAGPEQIVTNRWTGTRFDFVKSLGFRELGGDRVELEVLRSDLEIPRGATIGITVVSERSGSALTDRAPDAGSYPLVIDPTPTAPAVAPAIVAAALPEQTSARLSAQVNPQGLPTEFRFEYGTTASYGAQTVGAAAGTGRAALVVRQSVTGLAPGTLHHYRVVATNAAGISFGPDQTFSTAHPVPIAATGQAFAVSPRSLRLTGTATTGAAGGSAFFEYGPSARLGARTVPLRLDGTSTVVRADVRGLRPGTSYLYRLTVDSPGGRSVGETLSARTGEKNRIVAVIDSPVVGAGGNLTIPRFRATVRVIGSTGDVASSPTALRRARVHVMCTRGCGVNERISLRLPRSSGRSADGSRVAIRITRNPGDATIDLTRLFIGHPFRKGSEIQLRLSGPGLRGSVTRITLTSSAEQRRCALRRGRPIDCVRL